MTVEGTEVGAMEPETEMDAIEPLNPLHMRKFLNLVEFVQDLLSGPFANLFLKWTYPFGRTIIELSSGYPLISGFYKLLAVTIKLADSKNYFLPGCLTSSGGDNMQVSQDIEVDINGSSNAGAFVSHEDRRLCMELFRKYLREVLVASKRYKLELLAACLRLCLSAPPALIEIAPLIQPMRNALKIGLRYPESTCFFSADFGSDVTCVYISCYILLT
jgi:DNA-dependent protein kinase catalytic subunit